MKKNSVYFFIALMLVAPHSVSSATCSKNNLTQCLDSVCAKNIGANPGARCQYCGTSDAGSVSDELQSLSLGQSAKNTVSATELKSAPTDPGARYIWATQKCVEKISDCTTADVSETYDVLIEQSCKAAGINAKISVLGAATTSKTLSECTSTLQSCLIDESKCNVNMTSCGNDSDFNAFFATCAVSATGCDEHTSQIKESLIQARDTAIAGNADLMASIVAKYQSLRTASLSSATALCQDNSGRASCIETVCKNNMTHKCGDGFASERAMATSLCKFYDTACATLR